MNDENTKRLYQKYPKIFVEKDLPMTQSCMAFGVACGDGWYTILDTLCGAIQYHIENPAWVPENYIIRSCKKAWTKLVWNSIIFPTRNIWTEKQWEIIQKVFSVRERFYPPKVSVQQVVAKQVKQKFGYLCFYYTGGDSTIAAYVNMVERISIKTCECCGAVGYRVNDNGWISVKCERCREKSNVPISEKENTEQNL